MSIITFWNNEKETTGKTMSLVAIATYMAIEHNTKTLIIPTTNKKDKIKPCFFEEEKRKKINLGIFGPNKNSLDIEAGIKGIAKIMQSNKLSPNTITNYTKVVFKDRLEILENNEEKENIKEIEKEENQLLNSPKTLLLIGRYDSYSKYNSKNISRYLGEKNQVLTIPYNTLFFEAAEEANVPDLFLNYRRIKDITDKNNNFISEVKRASENIIYRIQEIQANII